MFGLLQYRYTAMFPLFFVCLFVCLFIYLLLFIFIIGGGTTGASGPSTFQTGGHGPSTFLTVLFLNMVKDTPAVDLLFNVWNDEK